MDFRQEVAGLRVEILGGLAKEEQSALYFAFVVAERALKQMARGIAGVDLERLLKRGLSFFRFTILVKQLRLAAIRFGIRRILGDDLIHHLEGRLMLALRVLCKGPVNRLMNGLTAPFEFLAAATRAGGVGFQSHETCLSLAVG